MSPRTEVLDAIRNSHGHAHIIGVPVDFIDLCGDSDSALLLAQLLYWTDRARLPDRWVYKSRREWCEELRMNRYRFDMARRRIREMDLLEESYHLVGARRILHMRLRHDLLCARLRARPHVDGMPAPIGAVEGAPGPDYGQPCEECAVAASGARKTTAGHSVQRPAGRRRAVMPADRIPQLRAVETEPSGRSEVGHPRTETPAEIPPETPSQTTSQIPAEAAAAKGLKDGERNGAMEWEASKEREGEGSEQPPAGTASEPQPEERHRSSVRGEPAVAGRAESHVAMCSDTLYEDRLFEILERADGFPKDHNIQRVRHMLDQFPEMDHIAAFGAFVEYYSGIRLVAPWEALRTWLQRRADELVRRGMHERPRDSVQVTLPSGVVRLVSVRRGGARSKEPAPSGSWQSCGAGQAT